MFSSVPAALESTHVTFDNTLLYDLATQRRATVQIVINAMASLLAILWTWSVCAAFNMAVRSFFAERRVSLDALRLYVSISRKAIDLNLPLRLLCVEALLWAIGMLPQWLWTGALTPQIRIVAHPHQMFAVKAGQGSYPFLQAYDPKAAISDYCWRSTQLNGTFSNCPSREKSGLIIQSLSTASTAAGEARNHSKLDNSGYSYVDRSYGVAPQ